MWFRRLYVLACGVGVTTSVIPHTPPPPQKKKKFCLRRYVSAMNTASEGFIATLSFVHKTVLGYIQSDILLNATPRCYD